MTKEEASSLIQRQYRKNKAKKETQQIAKDILNDIIENSFNKK